MWAKPKVLSSYHYWVYLSWLASFSLCSFLLTNTNFPQNVWVLIANFTSANACLGDEFENYCFIKRILSLKEAFVWGRTRLDWYISHAHVPALLVAAFALLTSTLTPLCPNLVFPASWQGRLRAVYANEDGTSSALCSPTGETSEAALFLLWMRFLLLCSKSVN